ncbi:hypothetical protein BO70DRAFT_430957 [Aspergillus heteromorphus CBS 117.55]|uniref:Transcription factor domain-containing protein n=1 Tax=Aspergillus heteromorphus CBS 117.55 TaxID=1448321 RepID=A0A317VRK7_9EURO|nr:uncharacterized protein BO70DRAFT_430957 [Aspergillus heteromorphus CBS 117.55]PWY75522.1 hypothetical protein BO70DRAFT_430957 [Aspergillus heteromorphus CBS 117.55]
MADIITTEGGFRLQDGTVLYQKTWKERHPVLSPIILDTTARVGDALSTMNKTFHFVSDAQVDRKSQRSLRSHVMKGKNSGKTFHRASRLDLARQRPYRYSAPRTSHKETSKNTSLPRTTVERNIGNVFLTVPCPVELRPDSLRIINQFYMYVVQKMYPSQLGLSLDEGKSMWFNYMLADEAAAHCSIALMETCNEFFYSQGVSSAKALHHLSQAFTLVNRRIQSDEALSDSTLGIILMLIFQEQLRKAKWESKVHYEGLRKMVELRGGLTRLEGNHPLVLKICKTDITYALQYGGPVVFFRDRFSEVSNMLSAKGFNLDRIPATSSIPYNSLNPYLHNILIDATSFTTLSNHLPPNQPINISAFQEMLISILSRLIRFRPLQSPMPECTVEAAYHIGLIVLMMTVFLQFDHRRILEYELVSLRLRDVVESGLDEEEPELALWLVFLGGIWTSGGSKGWFVERICGLVGRMGMRSWAEVQGLVCKFPWVGALHGPLGRGVWELVGVCYAVID